MRSTSGDVLRRRIDRRRGGVEAVDVGEEHEQIGADHGRDARGEAVVVAVADLARRDGVVLVDDRHRPHLEQAQRRRAGVEVAAALLGVGEGDEDLPGRDAVMGQNLGPDARQRDLADGGRGLALLELQRARRQAEHGAPERDRAGGDDEHVGAAGMELGDVLGERGEPGVIQPAARPVDEERGADLQDDAPERGKSRKSRLPEPLRGGFGVRRALHRRRRARRAGPRPRPAPRPRRARTACASPPASGGRPALSGCPDRARRLSTARRFRASRRGRGRRRRAPRGRCCRPGRHVRSCRRRGGAGRGSARYGRGSGRRGRRPRALPRSGPGCRRARTRARPPGRRRGPAGAS